MGIFPEVEEFVQAHRLCGQLSWIAPPPTPRGYRVRMTCPCGAILDRWVTPELAERDLLWTPLIG